MNKKKSGYRLENFLIAVHIAAGPCLILYPTISSILKNSAFQNTIHSDTAAVQELDKAA